MEDLSRFDIYMVSLTSAESDEIRKPQPCVIISPDELNKHLLTVTVAAIRDKGKAAPFRMPISIENVDYQLALDQIRTIDKKRLLNKITRLSPSKSEQLCKILHDMFVLN